MIKVRTIKYIQTLEGFQDVVIQVSWEYIVEGYQTLSGTLELPLPTYDNFIGIEQLDEVIVSKWVEDLISPSSYILQPIEEVSMIKTIEF